MVILLVRVCAFCDCSVGWACGVAVWFCYFVVWDDCGLLVGGRVWFVYWLALWFCFAVSLLLGCVLAVENLVVWLIVDSVVLLPFGLLVLIAYFLGLGYV